MQSDFVLLFRSWDVAENLFLRQPFCKIQDGDHIGLGANGNITFLIADAIRFPKMYSIDTLHKSPAKLHSETDYWLFAWQWQSQAAEASLFHSSRGQWQNVTTMTSTGWGMGGVKILGHICHNVAIGYNGAPQIQLQKYPFPWADPQTLPHPWTCPTYDAKRHPDPVCRFSTMHWTARSTDVRTYVRTYGPTDRQIVHGKVWRL